MSYRNLSAFLLVLSFFFSNQSDAKVYKNIKVGTYKASYSLDDCDGKSFLSFMKDTIYPALRAESKNRTSGSHIDGLPKGEGVELRLTKDVSTYHVKYKAHTEKNAERSGRSFSAVGSNPSRPSYVADASYKHYLRTFERFYDDADELEDYYQAILGVVSACDASGFAELERDTKEVAADFVAVYVAEQYRHLISGKGEKLGRRHNWDDALLQVTLLASFHAGQNSANEGMFFEGKFTDTVYNQIYRDRSGSYCVYKQFRHPKRGSAKKRDMNLTDYWQFNRKCDRSGVNITRGDFSKMGSALTTWANDYNEDEVADLNRKLRSSSKRYNLIAAISSQFISNSAPSKFENADALVESIVDFLMAINADAVDITKELK